MTPQVEIVRPKLTTGEALGVICFSLFWVAFRVLIIWWAIAVWFPQLGITYWQLILPVYAFRLLTGPSLNYKRQAK